MTAFDMMIEFYYGIKLSIAAGVFACENDGFLAEGFELGSHVV